MSISQKPVDEQEATNQNREIRGRKPKRESRALEFRQRLIVWMQSPEASRPSLRELARELRTSHTLLQHHLNNLEKWRAKEDWRRANEIRTRASADGRPMSPWEELQSRALDRRALCRSIESALEDSVKRYEHEIERCINDGKMPAPGYPKLLRTIESIGGGLAAQRAQVLLKRYFSPEGQKTTREQLRKAVRPDRAVRKVQEDRYRQIRLQKIVERFEEIGGVLLLEEGQIRYFVPEESAVSRALVSELVNYCEELKRVLELNPGKVDFGKVKALICQRFPAVSLSPLNSH
jgi:hypothetical protein